MAFQPLYKGSSTSSNSLIVGDPEGSVGIVTLWSKAKEIAKRVDPKNYCVIGQLFSAERGLDILIRNLLASPNITNLVITGIDFSKSGIVLEDFFKNGFERGVTDLTEKPCWRVKSKYPGYIGLDIPEEVLNELKDSMVVIRNTDITKVDFENLPRPSKTRKQYIFVRPAEQIKQYQGDYSGYIVRGKTIAEAWIKLLDIIMKFGKVSGTHYDDQQKEVLDLVSVITEEDPYNPFIPPFLPTNEQRVKEYIPRMTRDVKGESSKNYTYGSRMRSWFGQDQIQAAIAKLVKEPNSRAVVISLWDPVKDLTIGGSPCLNHIWFRVNESTKKLYMTVVFRSHDMFEGYPENLFALRVLQEEVRRELVEKLAQSEKPIDIKLGDLICISQSAHLYDDTWETCEEVLKKYKYKFIPKAQFQWDERGNFIIYLEEDEIVVEHTSTTKETLGIYRGKTAEDVRDQLIDANIIGNPAHGVYIGKELEKAELALKLNIHYIQDEPLNVNEVVNKKTESSMESPRESD